MGGNQQEQINEIVKEIRAAKRRATTPAKKRENCRGYSKERRTCLALTETTCLAGECQFYSPRRRKRLGEEAQ